MDLKSLLTKIDKQGGTELHLKIGSPPLVRQNRFLRKVALPAVTSDDLKEVISKTLPADLQKRISSQRFTEVNVFGEPPCNFRLQLLQAQGEFCIIIKLIPKRVPGFPEIGLPFAIEPLTKAAMGLFIIAGPARSGISTSLASFVERINQNRSAHILVIEDPIEYTFEPKKSKISHRQFSKDIPSVEQGINFAKRMDVDILVLGDLKRELPFRNILDYVGGGHFVVLSMQTLGVQNTVEKILYSFPEVDREHAANVLGHNLLGICSQALLHSPSENRMVPIHEVMIVNNMLRQIIQKGRTNQIDPNLRAGGEGCQVFDASLGKYLRDQVLPKNSVEAFLAGYRGTK